MGGTAPELFGSCTGDRTQNITAHLGNFKRHLNIHDFFKKKDIRDKFTADEIYEIDKALLLFCIFSFIPFNIVGNFIKLVYL